jgi:hypothetical protein
MGPIHYDHSRPLRIRAPRSDQLSERPQGSNIKILITLSDGKRCIRSEEFMSENLDEEDIVGDVLGFEAVATDGAVGSSQVAGFPGLVEGAEGGGNVLRELRAGGGVNGLGGKGNS